MAAGRTSSSDVPCVDDLLSVKTAPLKVYCWFYGLGSGCLVAFLPVYYRMLGVTAAQNGILGALAPLIGFWASPFWSGVADKKESARGVLVLGLCSFVFFNLLKWTVPAATHCSPLRTANTTLSDLTVLEYRENFTNSTTKSLQTNTVQNLPTIPTKEKLGSAQLRTFYLLAAIIVVGEFFSSCVLGLADTVILNALGTQEQNYGRQRLWHALGWGIGNVGSGALANHLADDCGNGNYTVHFLGFSVLSGLSALTMAVMVRTSGSRKKGEEGDLQIQLFQGVWKTFSQGHAIAFILAVFFLAVFMSVIDNFLFWFLKELHGSELLIGAALLCMSLAEVPVFAVAGKLIDKVGHIACLCIVFFVYAVRFITYAALVSPWWVLCVEPLHGFTFGLMWATSVSYAKKIAPPGMQATMQGILTGVYYGVGRVVGSLIGGVLYSQFGPRLMFASGAVAAVTCGSLLAACQWSSEPCSTPSSSSRPSQVEEVPLVAMETCSEMSTDSD